MKNAAQILATLFFGGVLSMWVSSFIFEAAMDHAVKNCKAIGHVLFKDQVINCTVEKINADK